MKRAIAIVALLSSSASADDKQPETPVAKQPTADKPAVTKDKPAITKDKPASTDDKPVITDEEEGSPKLSLPTQEDRDAWQKPGFRLALAMTYGPFYGLRGAPDGKLLGPILRVGVRLDADWSLMTSFEYASASKVGGISGLRFAGTLDPTWHVTPSISLAVGFGFGGIVEGDHARFPNATPAPDTLETSYTFPDASTPIDSCSGVGAAALARAEYAAVMGPRSQFQVSVEVVGQWTGCVQDTGNLEPDSGQAIERRQWWPHVGGTLTAGFAWR
jgi:hypothetical protein